MEFELMITSQLGGPESPQRFQKGAGLQAVEYGFAAALAQWADWRHCLLRPFQSIWLDLEQLWHQCTHLLLGLSLVLIHHQLLLYGKLPFIYLSIFFIARRLIDHHIAFLINISS
ncbi:hypothetical protein LWI28_015716 [Acer negundo]|uniref:Uncharacterized protein n=1 Tax=Acer negundo TaxID=4023 RepID=A0AAD5I6E7_ACENE|nr:hypothetical protein LWI28_015716 [Acer negundo]